MLRKKTQVAAVSTFRAPIRRAHEESKTDHVPSPSVLYSQCMHTHYALLISDVNQPNGSSQTSSPGGHRPSRRRLSTLQTNSQAKSTSQGVHTISLLFFYFWGKTQDKRGECSGGKLKLLQLQHVEQLERRERVQQTML